MLSNPPSVLTSAPPPKLAIRYTQIIDHEISPAVETPTATAGLNTPPETSPMPVTLVRDDKDAAAPFVDKETGSRWDIAGRAVQGERKGWTLGWADSAQVKWYAWAAEYPRTTIYGK